MTKTVQMPSSRIRLAALAFVAGILFAATALAQDLCERDSDCDDGIFCNGVESCDPERPWADRRGCVYSQPVCTVGLCNEAEGTCVTDCQIIDDMDGDGVASLACGGSDCDDSNADIFPGNTEICEPNNIDEDCDPSTVGDRDLDGDGFVDISCVWAPPSR